MKIIEFLLSALAIGVTFLYGSTGEIITEKAGHLNLGIPGIMGIGAACGCAALSAAVLPEGLVRIGASALYACAELISVFLPDTVTLRLSLSMRRSPLSSSWAPVSSGCFLTVVLLRRMALILALTSRMLKGLVI